MRFVGIDPGYSGAISWIQVYSDGSCRTASVDMPISADGFLDPLSLAGLVGGRYAAICIEHVGSFGTEGRASLAKFMEIFGGIRAVALLSGNPLTLVRPMEWKEALGLVTRTPKGQKVSLTSKEKVIKRREGKEAAVSLAISLYPDAAKYLTRKKDHDRAEALLLAHYLRIQYENQSST